MCALVPCARGHARRRCGAAAALPGSIRAPSCPNSGRTWGPQGGGGMVTNPDARAGWMPMDGGDLVVPVNSLFPPPQAFLSYLSLSLAPLLRAVCPRRISLLFTIGQDRRENGFLILHISCCKFRCSRYNSEVEDKLDKTRWSTLIQNLFRKNHVYRICFDIFRCRIWKITLFR